jgi:methionyl-tRNA formyltransferase
MKHVSILCTDPAHPVNACLRDWAQQQAQRAQVSIHRDWRELVGGDILFLVSCHQIIRKAVRELFRHTLVLHASALPKGRGMSPHIWQVIQGADSLCLTLLDAEDELDSGDIWHQAELRLDGTELHDEINDKLFAAEVSLMSWALEHCDDAVPRKQLGEASFFRKRTPADSQIDPTRPLTESFDQLRVADPDRYPAFFEHRGCKYRIRIDKV